MPLHITDIDDDPFHYLPAVHTAPGARGVDYSPIPFWRARATGMLDGLNALVVTSDLQAYDTDEVPARERELIGHGVARELDALADAGVIPELVTCGALLAGDLYAIATLDKRGGLGDVDAIWDSFLERFRWVAGVGGNHDSFSGRTDLDAFPKTTARHALDGDASELDGLHVAGISGLIGSSRRPWRRRAEQWRALAGDLLAAEPDVFVLHQGPEAGELPGHAEVNAALEGLESPPLVVCGHVHWDTPLAVTSSGAQVLNVDFRVVVIEHA